MTRAKSTKRTTSGPSRNIGHRTYYVNRELSWLRFNARVLSEALDTTKPLLERAKFLAIFASNLDEFFMIRVSGLRRQLKSGVISTPPDGMTAAEQLDAIRDALVPLLKQATDCWITDLEPKLREAGIEIVPFENLKSKEQKAMRQYFKSEVFPALTPLAFDPGHPFPHISNLSINLAVVIADPEQGERFARVKVPHMFGRFVRVGGGKGAGSAAADASARFVWLEEVVSHNLDLLFPGMEVTASYPFRVTRDADVEIEEDEAADLMEVMVELVGQRHFGSAVRLEVDTSMPSRILKVLMSNLGLQEFQVYEHKGPLGRSDLMDLFKLDRSELKDQPFQPRIPAAVSGEESLFSVIKRRTVLLYHPYDSFTPVVDFVREAAQDPDVLAIKQTLYRVGPNSPIVQALMEARQNGKQVSALVELKARFDEENNIVWARALERAGVHVVYGLMGLKVHAKMCLVVRRESDGIHRYTHLGTGNYNPVTAKMYTDLGYFTCDPEVADDVSDLFNALTGYSRKTEYRKLLVAPGHMRAGLLRRIEREIARHKSSGDGYIVFKMNSLVDRECIRALYRASQAGVRVDVQVRGICCLRPGVSGVSENIRVTSLVGRFLEHPRIYYFHNGGDEEMLLGSADLMPRNLDGRVEVLFPVDGTTLARIRDEILFVHLRDTVQCWEMTSDPDGHYEKVRRSDERPLLSSQEQLLMGSGGWQAE